LRREYETHRERTAAANYANGVLTMQVPAQNPMVMVTARLCADGRLPDVDKTWREALRSDDTDCPTIIFVR
jgi:hypothetical protein